MSDSFFNVYNDQQRSESYATLEFPGTYYLAFRDLPEIIAAHVKGRKALDFGCGAGRSSRFLRGLGFDVTGVDISEPMLAHARERDPQGDYRLVEDGNLKDLSLGEYDLVLSAFPMDNIPTLEKMHLFTSFRSLLAEGGKIINLVSSPEIYIHEWTSFSTKDFPANKNARSGDRVHVVMLDVEDQRPVEDVFCTEEGYAEVYDHAGLIPVKIYKPLGKPDEPYAWVSETTTPPWTIYVLEARSE